MPMVQISQRVCENIYNFGQFLQILQRQTIIESTNYANWNPLRPIPGEPETEKCSYGISVHWISGSFLDTAVTENHT